MNKKLINLYFSFNIKRLKNKDKVNINKFNNFKILDFYNLNKKTQTLIYKNNGKKNSLEKFRTDLFNIKVSL